LQKWRAGNALVVSPTGQQRFTIKKGYDRNKMNHGDTECTEEHGEKGIRIFRTDVSGWMDDQGERIGPQRAPRAWRKQGETGN
jgi:hypothetical protein